MNKFLYGLLFLMCVFTSSTVSVEDHKNTITLKSGATLEIPKGFLAEKMDQTAEAFKLEDPEKALKIFIVEAEGQDLSQAIDKAWKRVDPQFRAKIADKAEALALLGYDDLLIQHYVSDPDTRIQGVAERKGNTIWILLISGPKRDFVTRSAPFNSLLTSLKVPGMVEEDLSQKPLNSVMSNIDQLDQFITKGMKELSIPGLSIAIIEDDKIVFEKGYGVTKWGGEDPVTPQTLMKIGSVSKSMTTLLMAKLIKEGKFGWHTKARDLYPDFKVGDDKLSGSLEMEQLVSMGTGLPSEDFPLFFSYHRFDPFQQLALIKPTAKNKEAFQYNNQLLAVAGNIAAHTAEPNKPMDQAYTDLMAEKLFKPMGMKQTTFAPKGIYAFPHTLSLNGDVQAMTLQGDEFSDYLNSAGGIWSTTPDMALYLITELKKGVNAEGTRVFDETNLMCRRTPQVQIGYNRHYSLGWFVGKIKGLTQIYHGGDTLGFNALLEFFPEKHCGFVVLINKVGNIQFRDAIEDKMLELWFGTNHGAAEKLEFFSKQAKQSKQQAEGASKGFSEPNPQWMKPFLGKHENKQLGIFEIKKIRKTIL